MVLQGTVSSALEALPARPPTPPREKMHDAGLKEKLARQCLNPTRSLQTPPNYSPDSSDLSNPTSRRTRKRVGFSSQTEYCEAPDYNQNAKKQPTPLSACSAASLSGPIKSILKPSPPVNINPLDPSMGIDDATIHANIATMLESTIKQLAGADRESKVDAYMILVRALKASNNLPDRVALKDKMTLFMQFIQRDVTIKTPTGSLDTALASQALALLCTFNQFPAIASTLSNDFGIFIVDHCIRSFEDVSVPKEVVRYIMHVMATQNFSPKVMTADRVGRLVSALRKIEEHVTGKSIVQGRIMIYRRLIQNSKPHMVLHSCWLEDLFTDMVSSVKEIRATAIALGLEASFTIGSEKQLSRKVMEVLHLMVKETKYINFYIDELRQMAKGRQSSSCVPQIWSVVILLLRTPLWRWEYCGPLLEIIQLCFNSSDFHTKMEANYAWNRLVYVLHVNDQPFSKNMGTICGPFVSQLRRKGAGKQSEELRNVVVGSICNLIYYAFKPNTSSSCTDTYWDSCIRTLLQPMVVLEVDGKSSEGSLAAAQDLTTQATMILTGLFNSSTPRLWKEDRISDNCGLIKPEELPALDPKWVRRNADRVFAMIELILSKSFCDLVDKGSPTFKLWSTLVHAVASAASKEIKVSTDTTVFLAHAFTFFLQVWSRGIQPAPAGGDQSTLFFNAAHVFLSTMIHSLGLLPFTEKQLCTGQQNTFVPISTPSHRSTKGQGVVRTPLYHLFSILSVLPPGTNDDENLADVIRSVLQPFVAVKGSRARVEIAQELMLLLPMDSLSPYGPWLIISEVLSGSLDNSQTSHSSSNSSGQLPVGHEYRDIVKHLERGIKSTPNLPWDHWKSLFDTLVLRANEETGEAGCSIAIIEPLAKAMLDILSHEPGAKISLSLFRCGIGLISSAKQPRDRQALDAGRRRLWGTTVAGPRSSASFDPFENLYRLINHLLDVSYRQYDENETDEVVVPLLTVVTDFLTRCNQLLVFKTLVVLQDSIGIWIQDTDAHYNSQKSSTVSEAIKLLWDRICNVFIEADNLQQVQLDMLEPLLCSAFESKHRHIVNAVATLWNKAFKQVDNVQYPDRLKTVLLSLHPYVDIVLPGLDTSSYESGGRQPSFIESQDDMAALNASTRTSKRDKSSSRPSSRRSATPNSAKLPLPSRRRLEITSDSSRPKSVKSSRRSSTPRLRHDDSQIQFAAIGSSSPTHAATSQILTDRQKEVRERQQENAALFPGIRATAEKTKPKQQGVPISNTPDESEEKACTPKTHRTFEDYVASTPTPLRRRGQAIPIVDLDNDHEMADDVPSSPPEPRRYPLVPEIIKPQASSSSVFDGWPLSSSPISGSPLQNRQGLSNEGQSVEAETSGKRAEKANEVLQKGDASENDGGRRNEEGEGREQEANQEEPLQARKSLPPSVNEPVTPQTERFFKAQETPKSDNEVYLDALTSPAPQTPRASQSVARMDKPADIVASNSSQSKDRSFEASEVDWRLVVEIDSRRCEPMPTYIDESSSEKPHHAAGSPVLDCITVSTGSEKRRLRSKRLRGEPSSPIATPTPAEAEESQASSTKLKKKRKRTPEQSLESGQKKPRHDEEVNEDADAVSPSQLPPNTGNVLSTQSMISGKEAPQSYSQESSGLEPMDEDDDCPKSPSSVVGDESEAVNLQLVQEASRSEEATLDGILHDETAIQPTAEVTEQDVGMEQQDVEEGYLLRNAITQTDEVKPSTEVMTPAQKIMESLRGGLNELRTANLSREEVYRIESLFFDIKKELYEAESRGRN